MKPTFRALAAFDRYYFVLMLAVAPCVLWLNLHHQTMQGITGNYQDFKRIILAGFDPAAGRAGTPTFPMWGYGWLMLLTENRVLLLTLQNALAILSVVVLLRCVERAGFLSPGCLRLIKGLLVVSVPWYAFHSVVWPYSVAVSLFLLSFGLFVWSWQRSPASLVWLTASGLLFGLALNFRSDYLLLGPALALVAVWFKGWGWRPLGCAAVWLGSAYVLLVPWAMYTRQATGHYLLTSTNAGPVFFCGLGVLPDNKWGITCSDGDPLMHRLLEERFGSRETFVSYRGSRFLMGEFLKRVKDDPREFGRKLAYSVSHMVKDGCYPGEFSELPEDYPLGQQEGIVRYFLASSSLAVGGRLVRYSFFLLPLVAGWALWRRNLLVILVCTVIAYQAAVNVLACHSRLTASMTYSLHCINLACGLSALAQELAWLLPPARRRLAALAPAAVAAGLLYPAGIEVGKAWVWSRLAGQAASLQQLVHSGAFDSRPLVDHLDWMSAAGGNSVHRESDGSLHIVTDQSRFTRQAEARIAVPGDVDALAVHYTLDVKRGGLMVGICNARGQCISSKLHLTPGTQTGTLMVPRCGGGFVTLAIQNYLANKGVSEVNVCGTDVYRVFPNKR